MTEQKIEQLVRSKIEAALQQAQIGDYQTISTWSPAETIKAVESKASKFITLSVAPRSYDTPTIPYASFNATVSLVTRADIDTTGKMQLEAADAMMSVFQKWQMSFKQVQDDFTIEGEFQPQGFSLDGGECTVDRDATVWTYTQSFTILGTITME